MPASIGRAVLELTIDGQQVNLALDQVQNKLAETGTSARNVSQMFSAQAIVNFGRQAVEAVGWVIGGIVDLGQRGAVVGDVASQFGTLSGQVGETADAMIGALREGTVGAISDFDLMQMANRALGAGLVRNAQDMGTLAAGARTLGKSVGIDTSEAFDTLTSAIASGRTAQLRQLGLFVDSKAAIEQYAHAHRMSVSDMTDADRATALSAATLATLRERLAAIPPDARDFGEEIDAARAGLTNFRDKVAVLINDSPVLAAGFRAATQALTEMFGGNSQTAAQTIARLVEELVIKLTYVGQAGAVAATVLLTAWNGIKTVLLAVETVIIGVATGVVGFISIVVEAASKIPTFGHSLDGVAASLVATRQQLSGMTVSLGQQTAEAARATTGNTDLQRKIDAVSGSLINIRGAMERARDGMASSTQAIVALPPPSPGGERGPQVTEENARKIVEVYEKLRQDIQNVTTVGVEQRLAQLEFQRQEELRKLEELKQVTPQKLEELRLLVAEKYDAMTAAALAGPDQIRDRYATLVQELALSQTTGIQQRMLEIDFARQRELQGIENLRLTYTLTYAALAAMITLKYQEMTAAALASQFTVTNSEGVAYDQRRMAAQQALDQARVNYQALLASGTATATQLTDAFQRYHAAERANSDATTQHQRMNFETVASSASGILRSAFGQNKTATIAAIAIDTAAGVMKSIAQFGLPWGLIPAAAVIAAGVQQTMAVRSQSFATGTPGLDFMDFGPESLTALHRKEAVVPQGSGHLLAGEIAAAMPGDNAAQLDRIAESLDALPLTITRAWRNAVAMA